MFRTIGISALVALGSLGIASSPSSAMPASTQLGANTHAETTIQDVGYRRRVIRHVDREHCTRHGGHSHCHTDHIETRLRRHGDHYHVERRVYRGRDDHIHYHYDDHHHHH